MAEITAATHEQSLGIAQVSQGVSLLDSVTQQNAALVEQAAAAAGNLSEQANNLTHAIEIFRLPMDGDTLEGQSSPILFTQNKVTEATIDLGNAVKAHAEWKLKLRSAATTHVPLDAAIISRDDCCVLGKWLHGAGRPSYGHLPEFISLVKNHAGFHHEAGHVAQTINWGQYKEAISMIGPGSAFSDASNTVGIAIKKLRNMSHL